MSGQLFYIIAPAALILSILARRFFISRYKENPHFITALFIGLATGLIMLYFFVCLGILINFIENL